MEIQKEINQLNQLLSKGFQQNPPNISLLKIGCGKLSNLIDHLDTDSENFKPEYCTINYISEYPNGDILEEHY